MWKVVDYFIGGDAYGVFVRRTDHVSWPGRAGQESFPGHEQLQQ